MQKLSHERGQSEILRQALEEARTAAKRVPLLEHAVLRLTKERDAALGLKGRLEAITEKTPSSAPDKKV